MCLMRGNPERVGGGGSPVNTEAQEPEGGGLTEVTNLVNESEDDDTPMKRREARRMARRSLRDEVDELAQPRRLEYLAPGPEVEMSWRQLRKDAWPLSASAKGSMQP